MHIAKGVCLPTLHARFLDQPLALLPSRASALLEAFKSSEIQALSVEPAREASRFYDVVSGVAIISVHGILVHERTWWFGETDYKTLAAAFVEAINDPDVKAIVMHINSPGGEVAGCFDLADGIYGLRGIKPIWAIVDESAYSAAYALASAADRIIVPRTGGSGSIGIISMHMDITGMLEKFGVKVTTIQFGDRKSDSYPTTPLSDDARQRMQADVDTMGEMFVNMVARNRGLSPDKVRKTEAGCFLGASGIEQGLVDAVMAPDEAFLNLLETID